jgi:hypothetical protein
VDVEPTLVADGEPAKLPQPGQRALDDPAVAPEPVPRLDADARETAADVVALRAIRWIRPGRGAPLFAGMLAESNAARDQLIWSASPSRAADRAQYLAWLAEHRESGGLHRTRAATLPAGAWTIDCHKVVRS